MRTPHLRALPPLPLGQIKQFNSELHEERRYDAALKEYTVANTRTQQSLAVLNAGQNLIISIGICLALFLAARQVISSTMTVGDFVMVQAYPALT
jgi:ABC-type transport system involved in Fe-S cluster assembly fused permease/ATPase subunit